MIGIIWNTIAPYGLATTLSLDQPRSTGSKRALIDQRQHAPSTRDVYRTRRSLDLLYISCNLARSAKSKTGVALGSHLVEPRCVYSCIHPHRPRVPPLPLTLLRILSTHSLSDLSTITKSSFPLETEGPRLLPS